MPRPCPPRSAPAIAAVWLAAQRLQPHGGARQSCPSVARPHPALRGPAASSTGALCREAGRSRPTQRRRRRHHPGAPALHTSSPHAVWAADFKGHAVPETVCPAPHSRGQTPTRARCGAVRPDSPRHRWRPSPSARAWAASLACLGPAAPITARPGPRRPSVASRSRVSGGARSASGTSALSRDGPRRTAVMHACPAPAGRKPHARRSGTTPRSRRDATAAVERTTTRAPMRREARAHRRPSIARREDGCRPSWPSPSTRGMTWYGASVPPARAAFQVGSAA